MYASDQHSQPVPISFLREREILARFPVSRAHWWRGIKAGSNLCEKHVVPHLIPISRSDWWMGVKDGQYSAGLRLSEKVTVWSKGDIQALMHRINRESERVGDAA